MQRRPLPPTVLALALLALTACDPPERAGETTPGASMDPIAEEYVKLVLAVGQHDEDYVDAYYGPQAWREAARSGTQPLDTLAERAAALVSRLDAVEPAAGDEMGELRRRSLGAQLRALAARVRMLGGERLTFDEESRALYDAVAPRHEAAHFDALLARLDPLLPGAGPAAARYREFRDRFVIPEEQLEATFAVALEVCRSASAARVALPPGETFEIEYVSGEPWSAYNWYQGGFRSLIQLNVELPIHIDRALDLACHEGYPGHHVYNVLLEKELVRGRGWIEFTVYPLFSPQSLIAEGTANYGVELAVPDAERLEYEKHKLFPLAGLDSSQAERYREVQRLAEELAWAGTEAARRYIDGEIDAGETARWLEQYALMSPEHAAQRVQFFDRYRSYVINYTLGEDLVRRWVEARGATADERWAALVELMSVPRLPSALAEAPPS